MEDQSQNLESLVGYFNEANVDASKRKDLIRTLWSYHSLWLQLPIECLEQTLAAEEAYSPEPQNMPLVAMMFGEDHAGNLMKQGREFNIKVLNEIIEFRNKIDKLLKEG